MGASLEGSPVLLLASGDPSGVRWRAAVLASADRPQIVGNCPPPVRQASAVHIWYAPRPSAVILSARMVSSAKPRPCAGPGDRHTRPISGQMEERERRPHTHTHARKTPSAAIPEKPCHTPALPPRGSPYDTLRERAGEIPRTHPSSNTSHAITAKMSIFERIQKTPP